MEEELKCPLCRRLLREPVLLHCAHSYCRECALRAQCKVSAMTSPRQSGGTALPTAMAAINLSSPPSSSSSSGASCADTASLNGGMVDVAEESGGCGVAMTDGIVADAVSSANEDALSETDSGVVIYGGSRGSRPSSFLGGLSMVTTVSSAAVHSSIGSSSFVSATPIPQPTFATRRSLGGVPSILSPSTSGYVLVCEACGKPSFFPDENFLRTVKENVALRRLVARFRSSMLNDSASIANVSGSLPPSSTKFCQWCEGDVAQPAESYCETCGYFYCCACQPVLHPPRGPLKSHRLVPAAISVNADGSTGTLNRRLTICAQNASETHKRQNAGNTSGGQESATLEEIQYYTSVASGSSASTVDLQCCEFHATEPLTMYCNVCRMAICARCLAPRGQGAGASGGSGGGGPTVAPPPPPSRHLSHDVQSLTTAVRAQKTELSQTLQLLSEKARTASEDIARLRTYNDKINNNCDEFKQRLDAQFQWLADALEIRRRALHEVVDTQRERKRGTLRGQLARCSQHLSRTTALIQFSIELLKETDPVAYMQVGYALANRVTNEEFLWCREMRTKPDAELAQFHLTLDAQHIRDAIQQTLDFAELKAPPPPVFETAECAAANNTVVLAWRCSAATNASNMVAIDGYSLEIDSGWDDGVFKEVYRGPNTACTIEGLHFNALYNARVRAFNCAGESVYSEPICLQTAPVVWFQLAPGGRTTVANASAAVDETDDDDVLGFATPSLVAVADELAFSNEFSTVSGTTLDYRTCLATVGVSRGRHYWEVWVERRENDADVVVGVAQCSVDTRMMLGKDIHGWSMYVDSSRSWFLHNDAHHDRREVGLQRTADMIRSGTPSQPSVIGILLDCDRGILSFFINDAPVLAADGARFAFKNMPRGLYYPAFSVNRNATITVHSALSPPIDGNGL